MPPNADLQEVLRLTKENNKMLHKMRRNAFWGGVIKFVLYAVVFLIGGAILSALRYSRDRVTRHRMFANVLIAVGAILPGIGGTATRMGYTEVLYVTELAGLLLIWAGYRISVAPVVGRSAAPARP